MEGFSTPERACVVGEGYGIYFMVLREHSVTSMTLLMLTVTSNLNSEGLRLESPRLATLLS